MKPFINLLFNFIVVLGYRRPILAQNISCTISNALLSVLQLLPLRRYKTFWILRDPSNHTKLRHCDEVRVSEVCTVRPCAAALRIALACIYLHTRPQPFLGQITFWGSM